MRRRPRIIGRATVLAMLLCGQSSLLAGTIAGRSNLPASQYVRRMDPLLRDRLASIRDSIARTFQPPSDQPAPSRPVTAPKPEESPIFVFADLATQEDLDDIISGWIPASWLNRARERAQIRAFVLEGRASGIEDFRRALSTQLQHLVHISADAWRAQPTYVFPMGFLSPSDNLGIGMPNDGSAVVATLNRAPGARAFTGGGGIGNESSGVATRSESAHSFSIDEMTLIFWSFGALGVIGVAWRTIDLVFNN